MKKISTIFLLVLVCMQFATVFCLFNANAFVYENRTFASGLIFNTTPDDIVSTRLLTNENYKDNDSIQIRNVNYQFLQQQLFQTYTLTDDWKYDKITNTSQLVNTYMGVNAFPDLFLFQRQLKQRTTEFQFIIRLQCMDMTTTDENFTLTFEFFDINNQSAIVVNFTSYVYNTATTHSINSTLLTINTQFGNVSRLLPFSIFQIIPYPLIFSIIFEFNSIQISINRSDYRYLEYQGNSVNTSITTTTGFFVHDFTFTECVYYKERFTFNYIDIETKLNKIVTANSYFGVNPTPLSQQFMLGCDSSLLSPFSSNSSGSISDISQLQSNFIEDTLFFHNRCDQFYNYYYDTTDLTLLQNPLAYNVNSYTEQTNQLRYIGDYIYSSNESINFYIPKSEQNVSASLYPRNICLPTWKMNQSSQFVYQSNKTYFPDTQLDAFHVFYQTNTTQDHLIVFNVFSSTFIIIFYYSAKKLTIAGTDIALEYQNISFRSFDIYFYPRRQNDGTFKLSCYVEYFGQKSYAHTSLDINLYGQKHNNTMLVGFTNNNYLWFATCENVNLYRAYNSMSTVIHHVTKQYRYKCVYETLIRKERSITTQLYADAPLMAQLSNLNGYYFTKFGVFTQTYETQHMTTMRSESQTLMDFDNTTLDMSYTNNETYEVTGSVIGASSLNNGQQELVELQTTQNENTNLTPSESGLDRLLLTESPRSQFVITALVIAIGLIAVGVAPIIVTEVKHHDEPINTTNTPYGAVGARRWVRNAIDWVDNITQPIQDGWNNIVNTTNYVWNNIVEGVSDTLNTNTTQHFNVVIITASTILQYTNTDATFDILTYIINLAIPIVVLILFVFLMKKFHTKLAILGFFIGIAMLYIMEFISLKFAMVLVLLFMVFAWVYLYSKKESDNP